MPGTDDERTAYVAGVNAALSGSYNAQGVRAWWQRPRTRLGGRSPAEALGERFDPHGDDAVAVRQLAQELAGPGAST